MKIEQESKPTMQGVAFKRKTDAEIRERIDTLMAQEKTFTPEEFTVWWATTPEICYYCGVSFEEHASFRELILSGNPAASRFREIFSNKNHAKQIAMSVDRKVPSLGYILNNICKACWICNYVKGGIITEEQMLWLAPQIATELRSIVAGDIS